MPVAIFSIVGYCLALAAATRRDPDDMPPLVVPAFVLVLYAGALLGVLAWATHAILVGGILLLGWRLGAWVRSCRTRTPPTLLRPTLTPGIILFGVGSCLLALLAGNSAYWEWDEFSHWGLAIKELAARHALWDGSSAVHFYDYPPGAPLFQYTLLIPGGFSEGRTHAAQGILLLAFLTPLVKRSSACLPVACVRACAIGSLAFAVLHVFGNGLFTLYVDGLLGALLGATLAAYLLATPCSRLALVRAALGLALLALTKTSGLLLALMGAAVIAVDLLAGFRHTSCPPPCGRFLTTHRSRLIASVFALFALPLLVVTPWHIRSQAMRANGPVPRTMVPGHERSCQPRLTHEECDTVGQRFTRALTSRRIGTLDVAAWVRASARTVGWRPHIPAWVCLSVLAWPILFAMGLGLQWRAPPHPPGLRRLVFAHGVLGIGGCLYLLGLLWAYRHEFRAAEALSLASFGRYVGTYGAAWLMLLMSLPIAAPTPARGSRSFLAWTCIALLLATLAAETTVSPVWPPILSARREHVRNIANDVRTRTTSDSRLYHVSQGSDGFDHKILRYELAPRVTEYWGWSLGTSPDDAGAAGPVSAGNWAETLAAYDYVLLGATSAGFAERYGPLFTDPATLAAHRLFAIRRRADGSLELRPAD
jgi:hypothetical protein